jgi:ribose 5-phosphate isomerase B
MKRFSLITEIDARMLDCGSTVELEPGGRVTPLAADTLKERRVTVRPAIGLTEAETTLLAPPAHIRTVAVGTDHTGVALKKALVAHLRAQALDVIDLGTDTPDPVDYPDIAASVAQAVARGEAQAGVVIDGAGIGSAIAANKVRGVRAVMALSPTIARYGREHNGANVLTLGSTLLSPGEAFAIVGVFLATPMTEARYIRRLAKVRALETP